MLLSTALIGFGLGLIFGSNLKIENTERWNLICMIAGGILIMIGLVML
jgi:hypothetical protein